MLQELAKTRELVVKRLEKNAIDCCSTLLSLPKGASRREIRRVSREPEPQGSRTGHAAAQALGASEKQALMSTKPPRILTAALVLPVGMLDSDLPASAQYTQRETKS